MLIHEIAIYPVDTAVHPLNNVAWAFLEGRRRGEEKKNVIVFILAKRVYNLVARGLSQLQTRTPHLSMNLYIARSSP